MEFMEKLFFQSRRRCFDKNRNIFKTILLLAYMGSTYERKMIYSSPAEKALCSVIDNIQSILEKRILKINKDLGIEGIPQPTSYLNNNERLNGDLDNLLKYVSEELTKFEDKAKEREAFYSSKDAGYKMFCKVVNNLKKDLQKLPKVKNLDEFCY